MPDEIIVKPKSESDAAPVSATSENQMLSFDRRHLVNFCAVGLATSFFLPWVRIFGAPVSGFTLQKAGDEQRLLWAIPVFCAITVVAGLAKRSQKFVGQLTGLLPFCVGAYWLYKLGSDLFNGLTFGAYLSLFFGAMLFILPRKST